MDSSAGLIALSLTEACHVSPHTMLVERERAQIAGLIQKSFIGLRGICDRASTAVAAFTALQELLREGRSYFFGAHAPSFEQKTPLHAAVSPSDAPSEEKMFSVRRGVYALGRAEGFDKILKQTRKKMASTIVLEGSVFKKQDVEEMILTSQRLEAQRIERLHRVSTALDACVQMVSKDKHLQNTLCAIGGMTDGEKFAQSRRDEGRRSTKQLFEWNSAATNAHAAFSPVLNFEGWIKSLASFKDTFPASGQQYSPGSIKLADALSPERKLGFAQTVVNLLDDIAFLSRKHTTMPESPIKDIYRMHFLLGELQKQLPGDIANQHQNQLDEVTQRFLQHRDCSVYMIGIECDNLLPDHEKTLLLRHLVQSQPTTPPSLPVLEPSHIVTERRTKIRRELKESLELDRMKQQMQEVMGRIQELKASSPTPAPKNDAITRFFPSRLEEEFHTWLSDFQDFVRAGAHDLIDRATKGERVDSKPIPIEKKMFELRLIGGSGIRIYCTRSKNNELVVLGFGTKTSQKQDILTAHERYRNFIAST